MTTNQPREKPCALFLLKLLFAFLVTFPTSAASFAEDFANEPASRGWQIFGETNLFHWNSTNENLEVTWDSSKANSYFYRPLGTILAADESFSLAFDLKLTSISNSGAFEIAVGFLNTIDSQSPDFVRGTGYSSPNLVEFAYFPAFDTFLPTLSQVVVSTNDSFLYNHNNLLEMTPGDVFHIDMAYNASLRRLTTSTLKNGSPYGATQRITVPNNFDFRLGAVSINSYSDEQADGSILANGTVDNLLITVPPPPVQYVTGGFSNQVWQTQFLSRSNWLYTLVRTSDFLSWTNVSPTVTGNGTNMFLLDTNSPGGEAFYRIRAERP